MLANLMPGFRHTRTPLTAGVLWFVLAWLVLGDRLDPSSHGGSLAHRLRELLGFAGPHAQLVGAAFAAVLVGGLIPALPLRAITGRIKITSGVPPYSHVNRLLGLGGEFLNREGSFNLWLFRTTESIPEDLDWGIFDRSDCPAAMRPWARDVAERLEEHGSSKPDTWVRIGRETVDLSRQVSETPSYWLSFFFAPESLHAEMQAESPMRLQIEQPAIYNEFDRIRSEADLRAAIVLPIAVLTCLLAVTSAAWLSVAIIPIWLLRQGVRAQIESEQVLQEAVQFGAIKSSTIEFVRNIASDSESA